MYGLPPARDFSTRVCSTRVCVALKRGFPRAPPGFSRSCMSFARACGFSSPTRVPLHACVCLSARSCRFVHERVCWPRARAFFDTCFSTPVTSLLLHAHVCLLHACVSFFTHPWVLLARAPPCGTPGHVLGMCVFSLACAALWHATRLCSCTRACPLRVHACRCVRVGACPLPGMSDFAHPCAFLHAGGHVFQARVLLLHARVVLALRTCHFSTPVLHARVFCFGALSAHVCFCMCVCDFARALGCFCTGFSGILHTRVSFCTRL